MKGTRQRSEWFYKAVVHAALLLAWLGPAPQARAQLPDPNQGPGGPILVITSSSSTYGKYYAEILRTEGLNEFAVMDIGAVTPTALNAYDVAILAPATLTAAQVSMLSNWVNFGGNLIAMRPDPQLETLLGLASAGSTLSNAYLLVNTSTPAGNGIVSQPMQFHGTANRYTLNDASLVATLYTNPTTSTSNPAVTLRTVGGGHAAAFAYDLATSIVYTRQGNPAWATQERDGFSPIRSNDKFYGAATGDPQPDWVDLDNLVAIPQADEQQRLLANLIVQMNLSKKPLPRFWYFPHGKRAVVLMTGDDHANGGTRGRFDQQIAASPAGCNVANWECVRSTSYMYVQPQNLSAAQAANYTAQGFEVGLHVNTNCADFTPTSLDTFYSQQISQFGSSYAGIPAPITQRHHCIAWSDWVTAAKTQLKYGIRLDTSFYFWPPGWAVNRPGHFTGSTMPMRFADLDGTLIDVYKAPTQMTDESGQTYPFTSDALLDAAIGPPGYYGVFTVNSHTDTATNPVSDAVVPAALARGVPVVSSVQMLKWLDARNSSSFSGLAWSGNQLTFTISPGSGAIGLRAMVPMNSSGGVLTSITGPSGPVAFTASSIKGLSYAFFSAAVGTYTATYAADTTPPSVTSTSPANGATGVSQGPNVTATFSEDMDPSTITTSSFFLRDSSNAIVAATVSYNASSRVANLKPNAALTASITYTATITTEVKDLSGNALTANHSWSFTTAAGPSCPCTVWSSSAVPANPSVSDPNPVELGVKFRAELNGSITGVRFYKGSTNTGTHIGNLWTSAGQLLATATFTNETASGWQQVNFSAPVAINADTIYVASYHTSSGNYAANNGQFATSGVDNPPLHVLQDGASGGNGVYAYSVSSTFPNSTYLSTNYWVDVVFSPSTTAPTLSSIAVTPANPTIQAGATRQFTATGTYSDSSTQDITSQVTWTSSGTAVATINSTGLATGVSAGTTTISARQGSVTGNTTLTVQSAPAPLTITTTSLPPGTVGIPYSATLAASGGTTPYTWSLSSGSLPVGLTLNATTGSISGTPTAAGTSSFTVQVTDAASPAATASRSLSIVINAAPQTWKITGSVTSIGSGATVALSGASTGTTTADASGNFSFTGLANGAYTVTPTKAGVVFTPTSQNVTINNADQTANFTATVTTMCTSNCTIWPSTAVPARLDQGADNPVELGVKFRSDVNGSISGIRFYKASTNSGTHVGSLWSTTGQRLASATFTNETASGWQQVNFATPVPITANTVYIASYHTTVGHYSQDLNYFATTGVDRPPLHALRNGESGPNSVYAYGAAGTFPTQTFNAANYWVDVEFSSSTTPIITTTSLPVGTVGVAYSATLTASGGTTPYTWSLSSGSLPGGLTLNATTGSISGTPTATGTSTFTVQVTDAASPAATASRSLSIVTVVNTGFAAPTANAPITSGAGDNNGFQTNPTNAYVTDGAFAEDANSGTNNNTSCTNAGKDKHLYYDFNLSVPSGAAIKGIEVRLDAKVSGGSGTNMCVQLSWNGGTTWTAAQSTPALTTTIATHVLGGSANTWGRTWTATQFSNSTFRVRISNVAGSTTQTFSLDGVAVRISYQ